ncbi:alpha-tocopherol transfer protein-like [Chelonus insularis]|uniref:alpha-tocopherol transfer protein-like n=1 Tax=Chelonus insularis TaxID=460826 RepID=UPI00158DE658|nr:alpha-tocopherol transfer protein-like [Chelonus insularis]
MALIQMKTVEEEKQKNPELKDSDIQMLREWCQKQPHLPKITDSELVLFLHSNYYRLEPTKTTIDTFYTCRTHVTEFFANRDPLGNKDLRRMFKTAAYMPLKGETPEGYKIIFARLIDYEPSAYVYNDAIKYWNMAMDLWMYTEGTMQGHIIVVDLAGLSFGHTTRLSPMGLKKFLFYLQDGLPVRLKGMHFTNSIPVMEIILNMMKPFMKKELMDILFVHSTLETVAKHFPIDLLPNESGGKGGSLMELHEAHLKRLESYRAWFLEEEANQRVNESLRPGKAKNITDLFGIEGSFKKIDID